MSVIITEAMVTRAAAEVFTEDGVAVWMDHPQRLGGLQGLTPREAIAAGRGRDVLAVIEGLADGVFF